jgi:hypothetical protein
MPDPAERFIAAATGPLGDNAELQMMAAQELRDGLTSATERPGSDSLEVAAENLETEWPWKRWKAVLYGLTALAAILAAIPVVRDYNRLRLWDHAYCWMNDDFRMSLPGLPITPDARLRVPDLLGKFTPSQRLLLFGDLTKSTETERFKTLWDSDPSDLSFFAEYFRAATAEGSVPIPLLLHTADSLDPQNAWYRHVAAAALARGTVERTPHRRPGARQPRPHYRIKDPARLADAFKLLDEAARMPRFDSHEEELLLRRLEVLPAGDDVLGRTLAASYLAMEPRYSTWIYGVIATSVAARAEELAIQGNADAFAALIQSWESFTRRSIESAGVSSGRGQLPANQFRGFGKSMAKNAEALGLTDLGSRLEVLTGALDSRRNARMQRADGIEFESLRQKSGFGSHGLLSGRESLDDPPPLDETALQPGRMAERAMGARVGAAMVGAFLVLVSLLTAATRFLRGFQVRRLSHALLGVLRPADYRWILVGGVVAPVLVHLLFEQVSETVEFRPWKAAPLRHFTLAGALLTLPALIAARRLGQRLGGLGWDRPRRILMAAVVASFIASGVAGSMDSIPAQTAGWVIVITIPLASFLILPFGALITPRDTAVRWQVYCRAILPAYVLALLLMALLVPVHHARERHWTRLNTLTRIEAGVPWSNRYEHEIARRMRLELLEIFDGKR